GPGGSGGQFCRDRAGLILRLRPAPLPVAARLIGTAAGEPGQGPRFRHTSSDYVAAGWIASWHGGGGGPEPTPHRRGEERRTPSTGCPLIRTTVRSCCSPARTKDAVAGWCSSDRGGL